MKKPLFLFTAVSLFIVSIFSCKKNEGSSSTNTSNGLVNTLWYATCAYPVTLYSIKFEGDSVGTINANQSFITWYQTGNQINMWEWRSSQFTTDTTLFDSTAFSATVFGDTMRGTFNDYLEYRPARNGNPNWILNATGAWSAVKQ